MYYQPLLGSPMLKQWKHYIPEVLFLFLLSLLPLWWMRSGGIVLGHDSAFSLQPQNQVINHFYAWNNNFSTGNDWPYPRGFFTMNVVETTVMYICGIDIGQRIILLGWFFLMSISMYIFLRTLFPAIDYRIIRIIGPVFYTINFFMFELWFIADRPKFSLFVLLPLTCLILHNLFIRRSTIIRSLVYYFFVFFLFNSAGLPPLLGAYGIAVFLLVFVFGLREITLFRIAGLRRTLLIVIGLLFSGILSQAYWLLPFLSYLTTGYSSTVSAVGGIEGAILWEKMVSVNASILNVIRITGSPNWIGENAYSYSNNYSNIILYSMGLIPILLIFAALIYITFKRKRKYYTFWFYTLLLLFVLGIIFSTGTHPPTGIIFELMMRKIPGFAIFRSSYYKFMPLTIFSMSILFSYSIYILTDVKNIFQKNRLLISAVIILGIFLYHIPIFINNPFAFTWGFSTLVNVPTYVYQVDEYIKSSQAVKKILIVPEIDTGYINVPTDTYTWGYYSLEPFQWLLFDKPVVGNSAGTPEIIQSLLNSLKNEEIKSVNQLSNLMGISHILFRKDIEIKDTQFKQKMISTWSTLLDTTPLIKKVLERGEWSLYEINADVKPFVYNSLTQVFAPKDSMNHLLSLNASNAAVMYDSFLPAQSVLKEVNTQIWKANCLYCKENEFENFVSSIDIAAYNTSSINSQGLLSHKETKLYNNPTIDPGSKIDMDLSFSNRALLKIPNEFQKIAVYKTFIEDIIINLSKLVPERQQEYRSRIYAFLLAQLRYVEANKNQFTEINPFLNEMLNKISKKVIISDPERNIYKYAVTLPETEENLEIIFKDTDKIFWDIFIDGNKVNDNKPLMLNEGLHNIELRTIRNIVHKHIPSIYVKRVINEINQPAQEVERYVQMSPVVFTVTIPSSKYPRILSIPSTYHPGWKIVKSKNTNENIFSVFLYVLALFSSSNEESTEKHIELFGFSNGWVIPASSESTKYTFYFLPQIFVISGFLITFLSLGVFSVYIYMDIKKSKI